MQTTVKITSERSKQWSAIRAESERLLRQRVRGFDPSEPRDEHGRWTDGGGGGDGGSSITPSEGGEFHAHKHPGHGYSKEAYVDSKGVIHTSNVNDAARAIYENKKVELKQPRQVSTLVQKLGKIAETMKAMGAKAPTFNLCNVSVEGSNLFCAESKGIPRIKMPQLSDDQTKAFVQHLKDSGLKTEDGEENAAMLRATQNELNGAKVAAVMEHLRGTPENAGGKRTIISRDNYILDGHHHWAGKIGLDAEDGNLTNDTKMPITRVDIPIIELLDRAEKFGAGHAAASETAFGKRFRWQAIRRASEALLKDKPCGCGCR